ncbi:MAG: nucleotidyltransferase domain-containing protein [Nitrospira sp.]|nr:nucleotidyltransferase domain-containing protein [Nitrospira sp.]
MIPSIESDPIFHAFLERIASVRPMIKRIILFGSRARGTHRPDSDYDVLLVVSRKDEALLDVLYDAVMDVLLEHGRLVSLKVFPEQEFSRLQSLRTPFMEQVNREGVHIG